MTRCGNCSAALEPQWKFCIRCGTAVERVIPAAIRPETSIRSPDDAPQPRRRIDVPLLIAVVLAIAGVVLVGYMIVTLSGR